LRLAEISVHNYKNYRKQQFAFQAKLTCFCGPNGRGKTNLLDVIYYLCFSKSYFTHVEQQNIRHGEDFFRLEGSFRGEEDLDVVVKYKKGKKKEVEANGAVYDRLSEHIGKVPAVIICPDDNVLILGGSEERRKFADGTLAQYDRAYLSDLLAYNRVLSQRNSSLKQMHEQRQFRPELLSVYDEQLCRYAGPIHQKRQALVAALTPHFNHFYQVISGRKESVSLSYDSPLEHGTMEEILQENAEKDRLMQRTCSGVHRDDLRFSMDGRKVKRFGSQGQQKSYLIALKLAQYKLIHETSKRFPILMVDDLFDKLDLNRSGHLISLLGSEDIGQVFITDTDPDRIRRVFDEEAVSLQILELDQQAENPD
jgi:DNA replication and repair protein RecF